MDYVMLTGELDPITALDLRVRLHELTEELRPAVTVDLSQVTAVHLAGIAALASATRRAERLGGSLTVILPDRIDARRNFERTAWLPTARHDRCRRDSALSGVRPSEAGMMLR